MAEPYEPGVVVEQSDAESEPERQREALRRFMEQRKLRQHTWATKAGVASGALYAFMKGKSHALSLPVLTKLAAVEGVSVATLLGQSEGPAPNTVPVTHTLRGEHFVAIKSRRRVALPAGMTPQSCCVALADNLHPMPLRHGALLYWSSEGTDIEEVCQSGRPAAITLEDGAVLLGDLRRGWEPGRHSLLTISGRLIESATITAISPIEWIVPS